VRHARLRRRRPHLRAEGSRLQIQRQRGVRAVGKSCRAMPGLVGQQPEAQRIRPPSDWQAGIPDPHAAAGDGAGEQHSRWQHEPRAFLVSRPVGSHWFRHRRTGAGRRNVHGSVHPAWRRPRSCGSMRTLPAGRDRTFAHGGTIKARSAWRSPVQPDKGLAFDIDNCSVTRLDHLAGASHSWRIDGNQQPWIADGPHAAMHQPAGTEVVRRPARLKLPARLWTRRRCLAARKTVGIRPIRLEKRMSLFNMRKVAVITVLARHGRAIAGGWPSMAPGW